MKKILATICAVCALASLAVFAACDDNGGETSADSSSVESSVTVDYKISANTTELVVFTATSDVLTLTDSISLKDYLDALASAGQISYEVTTSDYGYYISSVNGNAEVYETTYMTYWSIYTDLFTLDNVTYATTEYGSYEYNGSSLGYASYGVSSLPCVEGYTYALVYSTYTY